MTLPYFPLTQFGDYFVNGRMFHNDCAYLRFYKKSLKDRVQDFVISFHEDQTNIETILSTTLELFQRLMQKFEDKQVLARLVAKVNFLHINKEKDEVSERCYHFPSYSCEKVREVDDFYQRHMLKIADRLNSFNHDGSNLLIKNVEHVHILISFT